MTGLGERGTDVGERGRKGSYLWPNRGGGTEYRPPLSLPLTHSLTHLCAFILLIIKTVNKKN